MSQNNTQIHLRFYRSYKYAAENAAKGDFTHGRRIPVSAGSDYLITPDNWDCNRYAKIVRYINGAVEDVLSDSQRIVIQQKYLNRNKMTLGEIATFLNVDPSTVTRYHKEALKLLSVALEPLEHEEIYNLNFHLDKRPA